MIIFNAIKYSFSAICDGIAWAWNGFINLITDSVGFKALMLIFDTIRDSFKAVCALLTGDWDGFVDILTNNKIVKAFISIGKSIGDIFNSVVKFIKNIFIDSINWIIKKANYIPGVNIDLIKREEVNTKKILNGTAVNNLEPGGISQEIKNSQSKSIDNSQNIQSVTFAMSCGMTPEQLKEWEFLKNG